MAEAVDGVASTSGEIATADEGDTIMYHYTCRNDEGKVLEDSRESGETLSFVVGAGDVVGNKLFEAFDVAVRGMAVGDRTEIEMDGGKWDPELMFSIPRDHPEIQRLMGR